MRMRVRVQSEGDADASAAQFGPAQERRFSPGSTALGAVFNLNAQWQLLGNAAYTERAPTSYELYANGIHAATGAFERGNPQQALERGRNLDLAVAWREGPNRMKVGVFASHFFNYITLAATGEPDSIYDAGQAFLLYAFHGVPARLDGVEVEGVWRALSGRHTLDFDFVLDAVRGTDQGSGQPAQAAAAAQHPGTELGARTMDSPCRNAAFKRPDAGTHYGRRHRQLDHRQPLGQPYAEFGCDRCAALRQAAERGQHAGVQRHIARHHAPAVAATRARVAGGSQADVLARRARMARPVAATHSA